MQTKPSSVFFILCSLNVATHVNCAWKYSFGKIYTYNYLTNISTMDRNEQSTAHLRLQAIVHLSPLITHQDSFIFKLQASSAMIEGARTPEQPLYLTSKYFSVLKWTSGHIDNVYMPQDTPIHVANLLKGIASLLQFNSTPQQIDTSGSCYAAYEDLGSTLKMSKSHCTGNKVVWTNKHKILGINVTSSHTSHYDFSDDIIQEVTSRESYDITLNIRSTAGFSVNSWQSLKFVSAADVPVMKAKNIDEILELLNKESSSMITKTSLSITKEESCSLSCKKPKKHLDKLQSFLGPENVSTVTAVNAFLELVTRWRLESKKQNLVDVLKDEKNSEIVLPLIDILAAVQTSTSHKALQEVMSFTDNEEDITRQERYLQAMAFSTHPIQSVLATLLVMYKTGTSNEKLMESIALTLGAVSHTYSMTDRNNSQSQIVEDIKSEIVSRLKNCTDEHCYLVQLRTLANAKFPDLIDVLSEHAQSNQPMVAKEALKAIERLPVNSIPNKTKKILVEIFSQHSKPQEVTVRSAALMVLLSSDPSLDDIQEVISQLADERDNELIVYVLDLMSDKAKNNRHFRNLIRSMLAQPNISSYHLWSRMGFSSAFSGLIAKTPDTSATYGMFMENSGMGIMRHSRSDFNLINNQQITPFLSFNLYTRGMDGLAGEEDPSQFEEDEDTSTTAGMSLDVLGVSLRPTVFFDGVADLMSSVWNAPDEPILALQGNILLHDHSQQIALQNGFLVDLNVLGGLSIDLSGSISISLWDRNSASLVNNSGAMVVQGETKIFNGPYEIGSKFTMESAATIEFSTVVSFYETPFDICLKMNHPAFILRNNIESYEHLGSHAARTKHKISKISHVNAASFPFHTRNSKQCKSMDTNDD